MQTLHKDPVGKPSDPGVNWIEFYSMTRKNSHFTLLVPVCKVVALSVSWSGYADFIIYYYIKYRSSELLLTLFSPLDCFWFIHIHNHSVTGSGVGKCSFNLHRCGLEPLSDNWSKASYRSNIRDCSLRALLLLSYHIILLPWNPLGWIFLKKKKTAEVFAVPPVSGPDIRSIPSYRRASTPAPSGCNARSLPSTRLWTAAPSTSTSQSWKGTYNKWFRIVKMRIHNEDQENEDPTFTW